MEAFLANFFTESMDFMFVWLLTKKGIKIQLPHYELWAMRKLK